MPRLIGTAGHVDHGKTTLIQALTGIDADRLPEEKARGMTIDIGFAYVDLPVHGRVSIVDVPGHEKFLTNMLVGALGIDVALLVVAADASVMPQTREHFQILELLPVQKMVVALTRCDLADAETRAVSRVETAALLEPTRFQGSPIVEVSALTGEGMQDLKTALGTALDAPEAPSSGPWYLPIDRAFSMKGHGAVVTGTLAQGTLRSGEKAILEPGGREVRVRGVQSHGETSQTGSRGQRTALNLGGVKQEEIRRGMAVGAPGALFETKILDVRIRWLVVPKHGLRIRLSIGAEEAIGKVFLSEAEPEVAQLRLESPVACALGQPLIVRRYSPPELLGGGQVAVPVSKPRRKSEKAAAIDTGLSDDEAILKALTGDEAGVPTEEICRRLGKTPQALGTTFEALAATQKVFGFAGLWFEHAAFMTAAKRFLTALDAMHQHKPTQALQPREKVVERAGLKWQGKPLDRILAALAGAGKLRVEGTGVRIPSFQIGLSDKQQSFLSRVIEALEKGGANPPSARDMAAEVHAPVQAVEEILRLGVESGTVLRIEDGIFYTPRQLEAVKQKVREIGAKGAFAASEFRDFAGTSRKYAIPLLEYFDTIRLTVRVGNKRMLQESPG